MEKVSFKSGGQVVNGSLFVPNGAKEDLPGVIFLHGMTSSEKNYIEIASKVAELGIVGLTINLRAHGTSEGDFNILTVGDGLQDSIAAYDFLASNRLVNNEKIGICGGSLGGALAAMTSAERNVKSLALRAPAVYTEEMMQAPYQNVMSDEAEIFKKIQSPQLAPAIQAISKFTGKLLIVAAEKDQIIPAHIPQLYFDEAKFAKSKQMQIIKNSNHQMMDPKPREEFVNLILNWFTKTL